MAQLSLRVGRILLGLYFLLPGLMKLAAPAQTVAYMEANGVPFAFPLMWIATAANIVGGLLLIFGRHVRYVAWGCVLYIVLVNVMLHDFWTMEEARVERETQNFVKNLGIMAGLLVLAGTAKARSLSLKDWWKGDGSIEG